MQMSRLLPTALLGFNPQTTIATQTIGSTTLAFSQSSSRLSAGGKATCVTGHAVVSLNATNLAFTNDPITSQYKVSGIVFETLELNSTWLSDHTNGTRHVEGPFNISVQLCTPVDHKLDEQVKTVQVLTHGLGLDHTYWDLAPGYSYIDAAADAGHATLMYDRLGASESDHPDPMDVIQSFAHVEVLAALIKGLKESVFGPKIFDHVACVG
jgi:hypothetical protein